MEGGIDDNSALDYAIFERSPSQKRFEVTVCSKGKSQKISSGHLHELALHLPAIKGFDTTTSDCFKLHPPEELVDKSWFNKSTLKVFLNFINAVDDIKKVEVILKELNQLEDTRKFHVALYNKDKQAHVGDSATDIGGLKELESMQRVKVETVSSDATKNELLRALDLRLMALRGDFVEKLDQVLGTKCSKDQISNLISFAENFGNADLRNVLLNYLSFKYEDPSTLNGQLESVDSEKCIDNMTEERSVISSATPSSFVGNGISPAKIAQAERKSSTESDESSKSSDEDVTGAERSRPIIRSASPRRSASPMRRIQIGRSGSRRATAIAIKSLNYFPSREKISSSREADDSDNEDGLLEKQPKKSESTTMRMSVQDRINLFESKQRDQPSDNQKKGSGAEPPLGHAKSVLRRWSSGIGDCSLQCPQEASTDREFENSSNNQVIDSRQRLSEKMDTTVCVESVDNTAALPFAPKEVLSSTAENPQDLVPTDSEEFPDRATTSAEWTRQKEAELNQLMEMMEIKTSKLGATVGGSGGDQESSTEQKRDFYSQYKERRDEKLKKVNAGRRSEKGTKLKAVPDVPGHRNVDTGKKAGMAGKPNPSIQSQKMRRNSSPPVLPSRATSNVIASKRSSPKTSASPTLAKRSSLPLAPTPKAAGTPTRSSSRTASGTSNRKKPPSTASPALTVPHSERPKQAKESKARAEIKTKSKSNEENKQKVMRKGTKTPKTKSRAPSLDDSGNISSKPSFYNKVTRKSSVVPLEPKPFLRKGTGSGSGGGPASSAKTKPPQSDDSLKNSEAILQAEVKEPIPETPEKITLPSMEATVQQPTDSNVNKECSDAEMDADDGEAKDVPFQAYDNIIQPAESPQVEIQQEEDLGISSAAWVESDQQDMHGFSQKSPNSHTQNIVLDSGPATQPSPRVRHSLSQMLQADSTESEIIEWGNAENPPALVYQKDSPKGLKRLLKFARKSKGESNVTGWSSSSAFSDGEEDAEESKIFNKKSGNTLNRKATSKTKSTAKTRNLLSESFDGGNSSNRLNDHIATHDMLSASISGLPSGIQRTRNGVPSTANSSKGSRSFFSLSTFRSNKSGDAKPR